jgi:NAD(P)-dependent dehydrogenase (short-subunit alcohol dehydrogenase family)
MKLPSTPSLRLDGLKALVTGASSGIGLGSAVALAEAGAHVTLLTSSIIASALNSFDLIASTTLLSVLMSRADKIT